MRVVPGGGGHVSVQVSPSLALSCADGWSLVLRYNCGHATCLPCAEECKLGQQQLCEAESGHEDDEYPPESEDSDESWAIGSEDEEEICAIRLQLENELQRLHNHSPVGDDAENCRDRYVTEDEVDDRKGCYRCPFCDAAFSERYPRGPMAVMLCLQETFRGVPL